MVICINGIGFNNECFCHLLDVIMRILLFEEVGQYLSRSEAKKVGDTLLSQETDALVPLNSSSDLLHEKSGNVLRTQEL